MKVTVEELSPVLKKLSVELPPEDVDRALNRAYKAVGRKAKIPGFRPGKVPRRLLERHYGHQVAHEVAEDLVRESWPKVLDQEDVRAVAMPEVEEAGHVHAGKAFAYTAKVEVLPAAKVTDYEGLPAERPKVAVGNEDVDKELERIQGSFARLVPVEDRTKVEAGDYVVVDLSASLDGEPFDPGAGEGVTLEVTAGNITEGNLPEAEGHEVGATVETRHAFPDEEGVPPKVRGKEGVFKVEIKQIKKRELPPIDDELAKDVGEEGVDTLLALRGLIRERLTEQRKEASERRLKDTLIQALVERNPIDVPQAVVDRAAMQLVRPILEQMMQSGVDPQKLMQGEGFKRLTDSSRPQAELMVKGSLLLEAVAEKAGIEIGEAALEAHYAKISKEADQPVEKVRARFQKDEDELEGLKRRLREDEALAWLTDRASIKEVDPAGEEQPGEAAPAE
jgi:trigger factor